MCEAVNDRLTQTLSSSTSSPNLHGSPRFSDGSTSSKRVVQSRPRTTRPMSNEMGTATGGDLVVRSKEKSKENTAREKSAEEGSAPKDEPRYVQDEIRQQSSVVWDIIKSVDGRVFVCGSSKGMGEGVEEALREIAVREGGMSEEGATRFWGEMKEAGKYIAETW